MKEETKIHVCNISNTPRSGKVRGFTFYLDKIREYKAEFDKLEAICTDGELRPPYPYQWRATTKIRPGEDDVCEGIAGTALEAMKLLYLNVKDVANYEPEEEEEV